MRPAAAYGLLSLCVLFWSGNALTARALHADVAPFTLSFWNKGVETLGAARASAMLNLLPVFTAGLAVLLLNERLHAFHAAGACLILGGIGMTAFGGRTRRAKH